MPRHQIIQPRIEAGATCIQVESLSPWWLLCDAVGSANGMNVREMWKEAVVAYSRYRELSRGSEENHENSQWG
jgi:hypothetical protein